MSYGFPVVTCAGGNVVIAATDTGGGLDSWNQFPGSGMAWAAVHVATGGYRSPAITFTNAPNIVLTAIGPTGSLDFWTLP